jgi:hypothetical protein
VPGRAASLVIAALSASPRRRPCSWAAGLARPTSLQRRNWFARQRVDEPATFLKPTISFLPCLMEQLVGIDPRGCKVA